MICFYCESVMLILFLLYLYTKTGWSSLWSFLVIVQWNLWYYLVFSLSPKLHRCFILFLSLFDFNIFFGSLEKNFLKKIMLLYGWKYIYRKLSQSKWLERFILYTFFVQKAISIQVISLCTLCCGNYRASLHIFNLPSLRFLFIHSFRLKMLCMLSLGYMII
jgi:hypothetical protein